MDNIVAMASRVSQETPSGNYSFDLKSVVGSYFFKPLGTKINYRIDEASQTTLSGSVEIPSVGVIVITNGSSSGGDFTAIESTIDPQEYNTNMVKTHGMGFVSMLVAGVQHAILRDIFTRGLAYNILNGVLFDLSINNNIVTDPSGLIS